MTKLSEINGVVGKECTKCGDWKPLVDFYKQKEGLGGRKAGCKKCKGEQSKKWRERNPYYHSQYSKDKYQADKPYNVVTKVRQKIKTKDIDGVTVSGKKCSECNEWLPLEEFHKHKNGLGGKDNRCKKCKERSLKPLKSRYYQENKERYKEYYKGNYSKYEHLYRINYQKRRAKKLLLPNEFSVKEEKMILDFFKGCALTGDPAFSWDHVIPLSTGYGGTIICNMIPLRLDLNTSKSNSNIFEWFSKNKDRFNLEQEKFNKLIDWLANLNEMTIEEYRDYVYRCHENPK